jgi:NADH-quinone oxidoreductase subunit F
MVQMALRTAEFFHHESCGKCTPCREGAPWIVNTLRRIEFGEAEPGEVDLLISICNGVEGKCLCPLGDSIAIATRAFATRFHEEFEAHDAEGRCTCPESRLRSIYPTPKRLLPLVATA